ncbi:MAG: hypothetical protein V8Q79_05685 [Christensenellales bacterium]
MRIREDGTAENVYENTLTEMDSTTWNANDELMALLWNGIDRVSLRNGACMNKKENRTEWRIVNVSGQFVDR